MTINNEILNRYVRILYEKEKNGLAPFAVIAGVLQSQLEWAMKGELERKIVEQEILKEIEINEK